MKAYQNIKIDKRSVTLGFAGSDKDLSHETICEIKKYVELGFRDFVFDFGSVDGIFSSITIGLVMGMASKITDSGGFIVLKSVSDYNENLMRLTGIFKLKQIQIDNSGTDQIVPIK